MLRTKHTKEASIQPTATTNIVHPYCLRCNFGVSGAAETGHCAIDAVERAEEVGREIARSGLVLVTGATTGMPYWAAKGAKEVGGLVVGFSPAASEAAHLKTYHLPLDYHDIMVYTGFGYTGRNLILTRSVDALIVVCGRMGTLNEFTVAFETGIPIGVLTDTGGTADMIEDVVKQSHRGLGKVIYDSNPVSLVQKLITMTETEKRNNQNQSRSIDHG